MATTIQLLKHESIDRLDSVVKDLPKYKGNLADLILNFTVEEMLGLINTIHRDDEFKNSIYFRIYNEYFDEIEELIHRHS
jgi:hypothetical protein